MEDLADVDRLWYNNWDRLRKIASEQGEGEEAAAQLEEALSMQTLVVTGLDGRWVHRDAVWEAQHSLYLVVPQ